MASIIRVDGLVKQYGKAKAPAVKGVSFDVEEGDFFAFLGPNGAGKTTTVSILTTTLSKTSGSVVIDGCDAERQAKEVREKVGIIFRHPSLDPRLSVEENIRFHACLCGMFSYHASFSLMPSAYRCRVMELAEIVGLEDTLFQPVKKLSGGMQRKLEIIRCLIHTSKILFLDEPTQGLDAVSRHNLWAYINQVRKAYGTTVFLTTHDIDEAEHVDRVCIINQGEITACGTPEEMKRSLIKPQLILDADDRNALIWELSEIGLRYYADHHYIVVPVQNRTSQEVIAALGTRLTTLRIQEPTLEDAYITCLMRTGGVAA